MRIDTAWPTDESAHRREAGEHSIDTKAGAGRRILSQPGRGIRTVSESDQAFATAYIRRVFNLGLERPAIAPKRNGKTFKGAGVDLVPDEGEEEAIVSSRSYEGIEEAAEPPSQLHQCAGRVMEAEAPAHDRCGRRIRSQRVVPNHEEIAIGEHGLARKVVLIDRWGIRENRVPDRALSEKRRRNEQSCKRDGSAGTGEKTLKPLPHQ
jgi:hypothetical protein